MESNVEEALRAKEIAEKRFVEKDFAGAKNYALKAKALCPGLEGIAQMVATFDVYFASEIKCNGEINYYSVLGLKPSANKEAVKKQYRKMAVLLHPDKNKCVGADGAFKLVSEAWTLLSDTGKISSYDHKRSKQVASGVVQTNLSSLYASGVAGFGNCPNSPIPHTRHDTFWTVCTSCKVQYEYLRKYVNKRLSCKNCRGTFIAVETGAAPVNGSFPYTPWSYVSTNGYGSHGYDGVTYVPTNAAVITGNGIAGFHSGHGYASNVSFQYNSHSGNSSGIVSPNGSSTKATEAIYLINGSINGAGPKVKLGSVGKHSSSGCNESILTKSGRPDKRRKVVVEANFQNWSEERGLKSGTELNFANGSSNNKHDPKLSRLSELPSRRCSIAPTFDARKLLIEKARTEIRQKLEEMRLAAEAVEENAKSKTDSRQFGGASEKTDLAVSGNKSEPKSGPITVPDPDIHDFDRDRSEECFKPKQIWAIYDEDDGMPRLYCQIRQIISIKPFKIIITYLSSKTDSEFGSVNWVDSGFTKSCGHFRAYTSDIVDQVNIFSHLLRGERTGRGGCVRIFPKSGEIWAVYRNWSPNWDRSTPDDVRQRYEMVEVLDDYSEDLGVCVTPLIKLAGFKTVYQGNTEKTAIRWIPRREMLRFSHQVPSCLLKGEATNLPEKCWDLDPAATPDELLHAVPATNARHKPSPAEKLD